MLKQRGLGVCSQSGLQGESCLKTKQNNPPKTKQKQNPQSSYIAPHLFSFLIKHVHDKENYEAFCLMIN